MKSNYLLPHKYKTLGWVLFIAGLLGGLFVYLLEYETDLLSMKVLSVYNDPFIGENGGFFKIIENDIFNELIALLIIIGGLIIGFSKEKVEDEFIYKLRIDSLVWAIILNYLVLIVAILFFYDFSFFDVMVFNMFTPLVFFVLRFNFLKRKLSHYEE